MGYDLKQDTIFKKISKTFIKHTYIRITKDIRYNLLLVPLPTEISRVFVCSNFATIA